MVEQAPETHQGIILVPATTTDGITITGVIIITTIITDGTTTTT